MYLCEKHGEQFVIDVFMWRYGAKHALMHWAYVGWGIGCAVFEFI